MPAILKDVARMAGVNESTASRAIRGDPTQRISAATRRRILEAAGQLGYRANYLGRGLRHRRTSTIGLLVPNLDFFTFADIVHGVQATAVECDRSLLLVEVDQFRGAPGTDSTDELIYQRLVADGRVDGLIVGSRTIGDKLVRRLADRGFPLVMVNRRVTGVPHVIARDEDATRLAAEQLALAGHRRVGLVSVVVQGEDVGIRRERAFLRAAREFDFTTEEQLIVRSPMTDEDGRINVHRLFKQNGDDPPTALFIASMSIGLGVLQGIRELGISVPRDLSVITYPDHKIAGHTNPPISAITAPMFKMGMEAGRQLIAKVDGSAIGRIQLSDAPAMVDRGSIRTIG